MPRDFCIGKLSDNRFTRPVKRSIVRSIAARNGPRTILNQYYGLLGDEARSRFHAQYSKIFRDHGIPLAPGEWVVHFINRKIRLPLRPSWSWLDWDSAVSIIGHDIEVKQTYAAMVASDERPALFLDVGASYGMHSILFLSVGIPTISFEPNPNCLSHFRAACELNGLWGRWEQVAIGGKAGKIELVYPEKETWLGSVSSDAVANLKKSGDVIAQWVPLKTLDNYLGNIPRDRILVKIDVEGFERDVIQGGEQLLRICKPKLIFESNDARSRRELFQLLADSGYSVHSLPWHPAVDSRFLRVDEFLTDPATNFIAMARSA